VARLFGIIGYPLSHSFSPAYFSGKFKSEGIIDSDYRAFPMEDLAKLPSLVQKFPDLIGLNVTIPYKEKIMAYLDEIDPVAEEIGAVNTIKIIRTGKNLFLKGFNTDVYGFHESIKPFLNKQHRRALILGTGGASKAVAYALRKLEIAYLSVSRNPLGPNCIAYENITQEVMSIHHIIINTTPLGMFPNIDSYPQIPYHLLSPNHFLYDLVYNPEVTTFMKKGLEIHASVKNGYEMLLLQAERSWDIWNIDNL
jgi:shikimate dehydrogenase